MVGLTPDEERRWQELGTKIECLKEQIDQLLEDIERSLKKIDSAIRRLGLEDNS